MTSSNPNRLPKALSPNTITLGLRLQREFWTGHKYSSITPSLGSHFLIGKLEMILLLKRMWVKGCRECEGSWHITGPQRNTPVSCPLPWIARWTTAFSRTAAS